MKDRHAQGHIIGVGNNNIHDGELPSLQTYTRVRAVPEPFTGRILVSLSVFRVIMEIPGFEIWEARAEHRIVLPRILFTRF